LERNIYRIKIKIKIMTVSYLWNCTRVDVYPVEDENPDVVYKVHWNLLGASDQDLMPSGQPYQAARVGNQMLDTSIITDFIPFEDLTDEIVTDWVIAAMGPEEVAALELSIFNMIEEQVNPTSISLIVGLPIPE
tara:strand:- start:64 stop:465 length:402 start_codon:yes stop_codon:yes gene_type:complete